MPSRKSRKNLKAERGPWAAACRKRRAERNRRRALPESDPKHLRAQPRNEFGMIMVPGGGLKFCCALCRFNADFERYSRNAEAS
jgi:hypothetical protein